jgi:ABC-2 type transport system permease protein
MLCGAIQAMHMGMGILAKEAAGKTGDFLLSKPVSRSAVLGAKLAAALTQLALTALVYLSVCAIVIASVSNTPTDWGLFWLMSLALFFTQVLFALMGFAIAAVARRIRGVLPLTLSIVFGFFVLSLLQGALHNEELRWLTPLKYFDVNQVLTSGGYQTGLVLAAVALAVGCVAVSWAVFTRKDIHAA